MLEEIKTLADRIQKELGRISSKDGLDSFRLEHLVRKGTIQKLLERMKEIPKEQKKEIGKELNILRKSTVKKFDSLSQSFKNANDDKPSIDLTLPGRTLNKGSYHPIPQVLDKMIGIFKDIGFVVAEGPEIEDEYHNFDALNFPKNHPARDMQDTFFIKSENSDYLLRTHTSPLQIRMMECKKPPIRVVMPGRVYRNEALDSTHLAEFHQVEGLYIDKDVTMAKLKGTILHFAKKMYGDSIRYRFRPSFFPFTEPSAELDISIDGGKKWSEIAGCGMVHPNVLKAGGIDPNEYTGFAFGMGVERVAMAATKLDDIRKFYENDIRVLEQF